MKFGKVLLKPGESMKEHSNGSSQELLVILRGEAVVIFGGAEHAVQAGGNIVIPKETLHSVRNGGAGELEYYYILPERN